MMPLPRWRVQIGVEELPIERLAHREGITVSQARRLLGRACGGEPRVVTERQWLDAMAHPAPMICAQVMVGAKWQPGVAAQAWFTVELGHLGVHLIGETPDRVDILIGLACAEDLRDELDRMIRQADVRDWAKVDLG